MQRAIEGVRDLVTAIIPADERERADQRDCQSWLASTPDIYRRVKPATPAKHLVSYAVLVDERDCGMFLVDHRLAGLWLPAGGHVEPGEDPADCARREAAEELGIDADFRIAGEVPFFVTANRTVDVAGPDASPADQAAHRPHTDVSLWYVLSGRRDMSVVLDDREFAGGRWWCAAELESADPRLFDPGLGRFLAKLRSTVG